MSTVMFKRGDDITMDNTPIQDGLLFFNEENHKIYMDNGNQRLQYGGDTSLISSVSQASSTNAFNASASVNLFLQKTTVIDTKANALAVTQNYIPLGCLAFKEMLGTSNYSSVGANVSAALINLANRASTLENKTTINNVPFYFDYQNGKYGYNTNANRGADTFHPFSDIHFDIMDYISNNTNIWNFSNQSSQAEQTTVSYNCVLPTGATELYYDVDCISRDNSTQADFSIKDKNGNVLVSHTSGRDGATHNYSDTIDISALDTKLIYEIHLWAWSDKNATVRLNHFTLS